MSNENKSDKKMSTDQKIDKLMDMLQGNEEKACLRHREIKNQLDSHENKQNDIEIKVQKCVDVGNYLFTEVSILQAKVNALEQEKLKNDIIIKGVPEKETSQEELKKLVTIFLKKLSNVFVDTDIVKVKRIGLNRASDVTQKRPIVVQLTNAESKETLLNLAKKSSLNCNVLYNGIPIGKKEEKIFIGEHLTKLNENLFFEARKLRRAEIVKFAWIKDGTVLIKKKEDSRPIRCTSMEQLLRAKKYLGAKPVSNTDTEEPEALEEIEDDFGFIQDQIIRGQKRNSSFEHVLPVTQRPKRTNLKKPQYVDK